MNLKKFSAMKIASIYLLILFVSCVLYFRPIPLFADTNTIPTPNTPTSTEMLEFDIRGGPSFLIEAIIDWAFLLAGILAFAMIVFAGFEYTTSGGNTNKQKEAQERIINAIIGIILLFSFWIILNTINPDILKKSSESNSTSESQTELNNDEPLVDEPLVDEPLVDEPLVDNNLVNITKMGIPIDNVTFGQPQAFLNSTLADKLDDLKGISPPWHVHDACINSNLPCLTTDNTRIVGDCHYYGTCVDIDSTSNSPSDNEKIRIIFNAAGLDVLDEGEWLHVALPEATGNGSYPGSNACIEDIGCWYGAT